MCPETEFNPPSNPLYVYKASTCDPILIQLAHAIHKHTQFKMIGKQSDGNDCSS